MFWRVVYQNYVMTLVRCINNDFIMDKKTKLRLKKILGIPPSEGLSLEDLIFNWRLKIGKHIYKKRYTAKDIADAMQNCGMKKGSVVFIQSRWAEFYNCTSSPTEVIEEILKVIGPEGTLGMACMPYIKEGKIFNVKRTPTNSGLLAEAFRKYPGVKRSINIKHSVCAIGPQADYLVSEHYLSETPWDKKSPYYRLYELNALNFGLGLGKYWMGTIIHCADSLLKDELPYYHDMFYPEKTEYKYIDYDGQEKSYWNYDMPQTGPKKRIGSYFLCRKIVRKYLHGSFQQVSNMQIICFEAKELLATTISLGRKGINSYWTPSKRGYKFEK